MSKMQQAVVMMREEAISSAERRLSRKLTEVECKGIDSISSAMMLESVCSSFSSENYPVESIEADIAHFSSSALRKAE